MHPILLHKLPFLPVVHFSVGGKGDDTPTSQNCMYDIFQQKTSLDTTSGMPQI